jgi:hypothetical protein
MEMSKEMKVEAMMTALRLITSERARQASYHAPSYKKSLQTAEQVLEEMVEALEPGLVK